MSVPIVDSRLAINAYADDPIQKKMQIDELKKHIEGGQSKEKELRGACEGFEAVFVQKIWEQMRKGVPKSGLMESRDQEMYQSMFDVELSKKMSSAGGIGLADMLYEQLNVKLGQASQATSPGVLKKNQEMKELTALNEGIELKPRFGGLKIDSETALAQKKDDSISGDIYEELSEDGVEYINPYTVAGQTAPIIDGAGVKEIAEAGANTQADKSVPSTAPKEWQQMGSNAYNAYLSNMQQDVDSVGSIAAAKTNAQQNLNAPTAIGRLVDSNQENQRPGVKFINPMASGGLTEVKVNTTGNTGLPVNMQDIAASAMNIPGFTGMKAPFANNQHSQIEQMMQSVNSANSFNPAMSTGVAGQMPGFGMSSEAQVEAIINQAKVMASSTGTNQISTEQSKLINDSIPEGMFMSFDTIPDI